MAEDELGFYIKFARPLIFSLPDQKDRILAASWVKKLRSEDVGSPKLRTDYLKLLLFALQRQKLVGIFADKPENYDTLSDFTVDYDLNSMAHDLIEQERKERREKIKSQVKGAEGDFPPYTTDYSADFREYVAAQDIPGFGVHCFYAISKEPISSWKQLDNIVLPKMAKSAVNVTTPVPHDITRQGSDTVCVCPPKDDPAGEPSDCKTRLSPTTEVKKKKKKKLGKSPPTNPLGRPPPPEDREVPHWGTNLTELKDLPVFDEVHSATSKGAIPKVKGRSVKIIYDEDSSLDEIEQALKDFRTGEISGVHRKRRKSPKKAEEEEEEEEEEQKAVHHGSPFQTVAGSLITREEYERWCLENIEEPERSFWQEETREDMPLVDYIKHQLASVETRQHLTHLQDLAQSSIPARSGLPVTTPKVSPSPKRVKSSEKLYSDKDLPPLKYPENKPKISPNKDEELFQFHADMLAGVREDDDRLRRQQEELYRHEMAKREHSEMVMAQTNHEEPKIPKEAVHIQRGSPEANKIFSDYIKGIHQSSEEDPLAKQDEQLFDLEAISSSYDCHCGIMDESPPTFYDSPPYGSPIHSGIMDESPPTFYDSPPYGSANHSGIMEESPPAFYDSPPYGSPTAPSNSRAGPSGASSCACAPPAGKISRIPCPSTSRSRLPTASGSSSRLPTASGSRSRLPTASGSRSRLPVPPGSARPAPQKVVCTKSKTGPSGIPRTSVRPTSAAAPPSPRTPVGRRPVPTGHRPAPSSSIPCPSRSRPASAGPGPSRATGAIRKQPMQKLQVSPAGAAAAKYSHIAPAHLDFHPACDCDSPTRSEAQSRRHSSPSQPPPKLTPEDIRRMRSPTRPITQGYSPNVSRVSETDEILVCDMSRDYDIEAESPVHFPASPPHLYDPWDDTVQEAQGYDMLQNECECDASGHSPFTQAAHEAHGYEMLADSHFSFPPSPHEARGGHSPFTQAAHEAYGYEMLADSHFPSSPGGHDALDECECNFHGSH